MVGNGDRAGPTNSGSKAPSVQMVRSSTSSPYHCLPTPRGRGTRRAKQWYAPRTGTSGPRPGRRSGRHRWASRPAEAEAEAGKWARGASRSPQATRGHSRQALPGLGTCLSQDLSGQVDHKIDNVRRNFLSYNRDLLANLHWGMWPFGSYWGSPIRFRRGSRG
jgi:hypothetical protein